MMPSPDRNSRSLRTVRLTMDAMFAAVALIFTYVEFLIPYSVGIPGVKLGLANIVILVVLYEMDLKNAAAVNLIRIAMAGLLGIWKSRKIIGGMFSLLVMWALKKTGRFSMIGVSMAGGVAHNFGQLAIAVFVVSNARLFLYFPVLVFSGVAAGIGIGIIAYVIDRKLPRQLFR